ncbi:TetR/AcrR family transcriptional regulator [Methylobacterium oxalidis]|uniref:TetR family transcriptional regulator n=1 Tax=Methylobacterium oxalidis TaxID=944322 RepID=A0A512J6P0_9HYPH|nr:TetR/AcrR family transcriptional regulator [Methylobacterium oxalidis]GEP05603.1 TetR family transcriptional regulator [Methylobacterium oxalidis]GJE35506.1 HTH-type transcriptional repressor ComR [Methylobacterium oxalidis]GLS65417.1 TetR family transcriptional regulator [Methylobacterium oxalidis]
MPWEKQFNREEALDKAMQAFWSRGYSATSMQDLVNAMGINRGSLYATFGDKHALFLAALRMFDEQVRARLLANLTAEHSPREAICELFRIFQHEAAQPNGNRGCLLTNSALELSAHDPEVAKIVSEAQRQIEGFFQSRIEAGREAGEIPAGRPAPELARGFLASLLGLMVLIRSRPEEGLLASVVDEALSRIR